MKEIFHGDGSCAADFDLTSAVGTDPQPLWQVLRGSEEVDHVRHVDLNHAALELVVMIPIKQDYLPHLLNGQLNQPILLFRPARDRMRLARAGLAVGKDSAILAC